MIEINGKEYRNLPQQVAKNANDIQELYKQKHLWRHLISLSSNIVGARIIFECHRKEEFESFEEFKTFCIENDYIRNPRLHFSMLPFRKADGADLYFPTDVSYNYVSDKFEIEFDKFTLSEGEFTQTTVRINESNFVFVSDEAEEVF